MALFITIYLLSGIIGYNLIRISSLKTVKKWTDKNRNDNLCMIMFAPVLFTIGLLMYISTFTNDDKESKW